MKRDLLRQHFEKSEFTAMQSDALALLFEQYREEMATKQDVALLRAEMSGLRAELRGEMATGRAELKGERSSLKADRTLRFRALTAVFGTVVTRGGVFL